MNTLTQTYTSTPDINMVKVIIVFRRCYLKQNVKMFAALLEFLFLLPWLQNVFRFFCTYW